MFKRISLIVGALMIASAAVLSPAAAATSTSGTSTGSNQLAQIQIGSTIVKVGIDEAQSTRSNASRAFGTLTVGQAGTSTIAGSSRTATSASQNGTNTIGIGARSIPGLLDLTIASGDVTTQLATTRILSTAQLALASVGLFDGFATAQTVNGTTTASVSDREASATRTLTIGRVDLMSIGDLLRVIGVDPLALTCSAVEASGRALGVDTEAVCTLFATAQTAVTTATSALATAVSTLETTLSGFTLPGVQADRTTTEAMTCPALDLICESTNLASLLSLDVSGGYGIDLSGTGFEAARDALLVRFDSLIQSFADLTSIQSAITLAVSGTCANVITALSNAAASVPSLSETLTPLITAVQSACTALGEGLDLLLDTPLMSLNGGTLKLEAVAKPTSPFAKVTGSLGAIKVGNVGVGSVTASLNQTTVIEAARDVLASALISLGIGLPLPTLEIMKSTSAKGRDSNGTWFADASLSVIRLGMRSVDLVLPDTNPLAVLTGTSHFGAVSPARSPSRGAAAPATSPAIDVNVISLDGHSTFTAAAAATTPPAGDVGSKGPALPATGVDGSTAKVVLALAITGVASILRLRPNRRPGRLIR